MQQLPEFETLSVQVSANIVEVVLNRPSVLNAINSQMAIELTDLFNILSSTEEVGVVILSSASEKAFCVGADLKERHATPPQKRKDAHVCLEDLAFVIVNFPAPILTAIAGHAIGGGCELAILSDIVVADTSACFSLPEVSLGIFPGMGGTHMLARKVGLGRAKEMIFSTRVLNAKEAYQIGLIDILVPPGEAKERSMEVANKIASMPHKAIRLAKKAIVEGAQLSVADAMRLSNTLYGEALNTVQSVELLDNYCKSRLSCD